MSTTGSIKVSHFGFLPSQQEVFCYTLTNRLGFELSIMNVGAAIVSLKIPIPGNGKADVVLGFDSLEDYLHSYRIAQSPFFGAIVGRYAGRIGHAAFSLNGHPIGLTKNHGKHHLHGGFNGFSRAYWQVTALNHGDDPSICMRYISPDGEENYPGELTTDLTYTLTESGELIVGCSATCTEDTIINLTQHSYFNLDGHTHSVLGQELTVQADRILETDDELIPTGRFTELSGLPIDFRTPKQCPESIDTSFVIDQKHPAQATLYSAKNKLRMTVSTDQPSIHIYVGGDCGNIIPGKDGAVYQRTSGICFEAQNFPDAPNHQHFPSALLKKGETYHLETRFAFKYV